MLRRDLNEARSIWLAEVEMLTDEHQRRTESKFLKPENANGEVADFHAPRHTFITLLASSGVHPKVAQVLARHSTITLTMDRCSHARLVDLNTAVENLPSLAPGASGGGHANGHTATGRFRYRPRRPVCLGCTPGGCLW